MTLFPDSPPPCFWNSLLEARLVSNWGADSEWGIVGDWVALFSASVFQKVVVARLSESLALPEVSIRLVTSSPTSSRVVKAITKVIITNQPKTKVHNIYILCVHTVGRVHCGIEIAGARGTWTDGV